MSDDHTSEEELPIRASIFELIFESAREGMIVVEELEDGSFRYVEANPAAVAIMGRERDELVGRAPTEVFGASAGRSLEVLYERVLESGEIQEVTHENRVADDVVVRSRLQPLERSGGRRRILVLAEEITDLVRTREELERDRKGLHDLYELAGASDLDLGERMVRLLKIGCERLELPLGFLTHVGDGVQRIRWVVGEHESIQSGAEAPVEESYCRKTLESPDDLLAFHDAYEVEFTDDPAFERFGLGCYAGAQLVVQGEVTGTICFASSEPREVSFYDAERTFVRLLAQWASREIERERLLEELSDRARTDGLTGLTNREALVERLTLECERSDRYGGGLSFALLDLDHFKEINDTLGHRAGDEILREVALVLERTTRSSDAVGRYGGEEFGVVAPGTSSARAVSLAERMLAAIRERSFLEADPELEVTCSAGVAEWDGGDAETFIHRADEALYEAKRRGRDQVVETTEVDSAGADV